MSSCKGLLFQAKGVGDLLKSCSVTTLNVAEGGDWELIEAQSNKLQQANQQASIQTYKYSTKGDSLDRTPAEGGGVGGSLPLPQPN